MVTWILIIAMNTGGYGMASEKIEGIKTEQDCIRMGKIAVDQLPHTNKFACIPFKGL